MDPATILADIGYVLQIGNTVLQVGEDAAPYLVQAYNLFVGKTTLTAEQRAALGAKETALEAQIEAPLPDDPATS